MKSYLLTAIVEFWYKAQKVSTILCTETIDRGPFNIEKSLNRFVYDNGSLLRSVKVMIELDRLEKTYGKDEILPVLGSITVTSL